MTTQKKWNAATIEMVLINSDTPIPRRVLHTHTPGYGVKWQNTCPEN